MAKIDRYNGNVVAFGSSAQGTERTIFGGTTQSDSLDDNLNSFYERGFGIVDVNEAPTKQDFNAVNFTNSQLIAYLHQIGVPEWNINQEYHTGSITNKNGVIYKSLSDNNIGNDPETDTANWTSPDKQLLSTYDDGVRTDTQILEAGISAMNILGKSLIIDQLLDLAGASVDCLGVGLVWLSEGNVISNGTVDINGCHITAGRFKIFDDDVTLLGTPDLTPVEEFETATKKYVDSRFLDTNLTIAENTKQLDVNEINVVNPRQLGLPGVKGNANYINPTDRKWYQDKEFTKLADDDTTILQAIFDNAPEGSYIKIPRPCRTTKTLTITTHFITVEGNGITSGIFSDAINDDVVVFTSNVSSLRNIAIIGNDNTVFGPNSTTGNGLVIKNGRRQNIENVRVNGHGGHGILFLGGCWIDNITQCTIRNNKGDGVNCRGLDGSSQKNAINFKDNDVAANGGDNFNVWGSLINIKDNQIGICYGYGVHLTSDGLTPDMTYPSSAINIEGNYQENNMMGFLHLKTSVRHKIKGITYDKNYGRMIFEEPNQIACVVEHEGEGTIDEPTITRLYYGNNSITTNTIEADFGGNLDNTSEILLLNKAIINYGYARVTGEKSKVFHGATHAIGINYSVVNSEVGSIVEKSENIITNKTFFFPIQLEYLQQIKALGIHVKTDCTNYNVKFSLLNRNKKNQLSYTTLLDKHTIVGNGPGYKEITNLKDLVSINNLKLTEVYCDYLLQIDIEFVDSVTSCTFGNLDVLYI